MNYPLRCVLDVSVSTKQFIDDPLSPKVDQLLDFLSDPQTEIFVPDLFYEDARHSFPTLLLTFPHSISCPTGHCQVAFSS